MHVGFDRARWFRVDVRSGVVNTVGARVKDSAAKAWDI